MRSSRPAVIGELQRGAEGRRTAGVTSPACNRTDEEAVGPRVRRQAAIVQEAVSSVVPCLRHVHPEGGEEIDKGLAREVVSRDRLTQGDEHRMDRLGGNSLEHLRHSSRRSSLRPSCASSSAKSSAMRAKRRSLNGGRQTRRHDPRGDRKVLVVTARQPGQNTIRGRRSWPVAERIRPGERLGPGRQAGHGGRVISRCGEHDAARNRAPRLVYTLGSPREVMSCPLERKLFIDGHGAAPQTSPSRSLRRSRSREGHLGGEQDMEDATQGGGPGVQADETLSRGTGPTSFARSAEGVRSAGRDRLDHDE